MIAGMLASLVLAAAAPATAPTCDATGVVQDGEGRAVAGIDVQLVAGKRVRSTTTDAEGKFRFAKVAERAMVVVTLRDGGTTPRFQIFHGTVPVTFETEVDPATGCDRTLRPSATEPLAARLALFSAVHRGFELFARLGIRHHQPLRIEVDDDVASPQAAYWIGPPSFNPGDDQPARIVLGTAASRIDDPGAPDNREYHELGHHALATALGALPRSRDNVDGGGYYRNPSSAEAWTDGFAIFFAAMIAREIDQRSEPGLYRIAGASLDLELDYQPWDLGGVESFAVASLLWDLVDEARDPIPSPLDITAASIHTDAGVPHLLQGRVHNPSSAPVLDARVRVSGQGWSGTTPVVPAHLGPGLDGWFAIPLPAALGELDQPLAALEFVVASTPGAPDDDPVTLDLAELWPAITEFRSERPEANGRLFDVADLYQALRGRFGGRDADGDSYDDIDRLFVTHGLFADRDGDHQRAPSEALGLTSHGARRVEVDGVATPWPAIDPRPRATLPASLWVKVDTDPTDAEIVVVVPGSSTGGYVAELDAERRFWLVPPPAAEGAEVSVIAITPRRRPLVLLHRDATALLAEIESHGTPHLSLVGQLPPLEDAPAVAAASGGWPRYAFGGGALAAVLGLILMVLGWPRLR